MREKFSILCEKTRKILLSSRGKYFLYRPRAQLLAIKDSREKRNNEKKEV